MVRRRGIAITLRPPADTNDTPVIPVALGWYSRSLRGVERPDSQAYRARMGETLSDIQRRTMTASPSSTTGAWPPEDALDAAEIRRLLEIRRYGVLATSRPDARPHAAPVSFTAVDGRLWFASNRSTVRMRNLQRSPLAAFVVMGPRDDDDHAALVVEGAIRIVDDVDATRSWLAPRWRERFDDELEWADVIYELVPTKVLSHGHGRLEP
jgi:nitroimidazol reductase NimA-like FMN-containing flavoprotein (pyridoxamine 5'-phosphate oxidase superfamily)